MPLELRKDSRWWYGRFKINNQRFCMSLGVEVKGAKPKSLRQEGDKAFERSRAKAQAKLDQLATEAKGKASAESHLEKLYEIKAGETVGSVSLKDMAIQWDKMSVKRPRSARYVQLGHSIVDRFTGFLAEKYPKAKAMAQVTPMMTRAFLRSEADKGMSGRTWNSKLILLRSVFNGLACEAGIVANPFAGIPSKEENTIHREPFTEDELRAILDAADDFIRPIIVAGMCTAMRLSDCCLLKWGDVELDQDFLVVKTSKTGETAEIPLFPALRSEITGRKKADSPYVFPEQAEKFLRYRHTLSRRTQRALKNAGIETHVERENGTNRASIHDFHSFRTTWITLALSAGVPMELVRRVTGHSTVDVVLKHYFRPGRKEFQQALQQAMPKLLTDGTGKTDNTMDIPELSRGDIIGMVKKMNARNWKDIREEVLETVDVN